MKRYQPKIRPTKHPGNQVPLELLKLIFLNQSWNYSITSESQLNAPNSNQSAVLQD